MKDQKYTLTEDIVIPLIDNVNSKIKQFQTPNHKDFFQIQADTVRAFQRWVEFDPTHSKTKITHSLIEIAASALFILSYIEQKPNQI